VVAQIGFAVAEVVAAAGIIVVVAAAAAAASILLVAVAGGRPVVGVRTPPSVPSGKTNETTQDISDVLGLPPAPLAAGTG
jgi:hypothetical protein